MLQDTLAMDGTLRTPRTLIALSLLAASLACARPAAAQTRFTLLPSVSVSAVSDSNVFTSEQRSADQWTVLGPGVEAQMESPRVNMRALYSFDMLRSATFESLNNLEARRHGLFDLQLQPSPKTGVSVSTHYDRSDNSADLMFESAILQPRRRAHRWDATPAFTYRPSVTLTYRGSYTLVREGFENALIAYEHVGRFSATRQVSQHVGLVAGYLGRHFINSDDTQTSQAAVGGVTWQLQPYTMLTVVGGPRLSSRGTLAPEITASLVRRAAGYWGYALDYWRGESIILGITGPVEVQAATTKLSVPIVRSFEIGGSASYFRSESQIQGAARVYHGEAVVSWSPRSFYSIAASYGVDFQHGDIRSSLFANRDIERRVLLVKFTLAPRLYHDVQPRGPIDPLTRPSSRENNSDY